MRMYIYKIYLKKEGEGRLLRHNEPATGAFEREVVKKTYLPCQALGGLRKWNIPELLLVNAMATTSNGCSALALAISAQIDI